MFQCSNIRRDRIFAHLSSSICPNVGILTIIRIMRDKIFDILYELNTLRAADNFDEYVPLICYL